MSLNRKALRTSFFLLLLRLRGRSIGSSPNWTGSPRVSFGVHIQNTEGGKIALQITAMATEEIRISEVDDLGALSFPMNWKITGIPNASIVEKGMKGNATSELADFCKSRADLCHEPKCLR